ncbi:sensor protein rcsC [Patellaria atrata CBS 101060]|uniref:histidine kinase n=1 Tax=Patellaria atrata CBS 101060 TaxID=1346257 RepID=A0A9P4VT64_9PEZI|nr:sensor protein rcsC [Patellaria atrata CBS 101060]
MGGGEQSSRDEPPDILPRKTLCLSRPVPGVVVHEHDAGFREEVRKHFVVAENNAAEKLIELKQRLRTTTTEDFWEVVVEGLTDLAGAQLAFVSKRILADDEDSAVEMPPIGHPGSCLLGVAMYANDGTTGGVKKTMKNIKYHAYSCPCAYMKHDKVFIIPEMLDQFVTENPNVLPFKGESYIGIPLFADGKCFAHFGVMWSVEGARKRTLGWGYIEMMFHALEDVILERLLSGDVFPRPDALSKDPSRVIPHEAISAAQSLKPYARSLSHELRTPMQGIVGMLDVMHGTVQEAAEGLKDARLRKVFETLKENIEIVQDSSRRAVEAADNVVHAYDMNMGFPDTPHTPFDADYEDKVPCEKERRPDIVVTGNNMPINFGHNKRRRKSVAWESGNAAKIQATKSSVASRSQPSPLPSYAAFESFAVTQSALVSEQLARENSPRSMDFPLERTVAPGLRYTHVRDVLQYVVNDSLKVGGRPESAIAHETDNGEIIEVRTRSSSGNESTKTIEWSVVPGVPETLLIDEKDLSKVISCVVHNAIKFTHRGTINVAARLSPKSRYVVINVKDTGPGIPKAFLPNLFKPFAREDVSLTRQSEGLGLGLLVAKGLARKLGGDLHCTRSETSGQNRGTEFEIRVPLTPGDVCSRAGSPFSSPTPSTRSRQSADLDVPDAKGIVSPARHASPLPPSSLQREAINAQSQTSNPTPQRLSIPSPPQSTTPGRRNSRPMNRRMSSKKVTFDRNLAKKHPIRFLVAEDNKINRSLLVNMLRKLGYTTIYEAYDGAEAVRQMSVDRGEGQDIEVILMDLWMPFMDGYEATERILGMHADDSPGLRRRIEPTILAITADVTDGALERAANVGMKGFLTKPHTLLDLERLIVEYCASRDHNMVM